MPTLRRKTKLSIRVRTKTKRPAAARAAGSARHSRPARKWSARVTRTSDAMDLPQGTFKSGSAKKVARTLKRAANASHRRKASPFQSAMSVLNFEINRAGKNLSATRKRVLGRAKTELRRAYGRVLP